MRFDIRRMRRYGKSLGRNGFDKAPALQGDVWVRMASTSPLNRPTLIAEILKTSPGEAILPTLHDVQIHRKATNFETADTDPKRTAQSQHCTHFRGRHGPLPTLEMLGQALILGAFDALTHPAPCSGKVLAYKNPH